ncbi:hypothetical protein EKK58_10235 [Candidatus Dependentiae bacterium]|nr:MAG: hypothetical protein EKK58_10235 [Candidatus Dependentiae bacterium]
MNNDDVIQNKKAWAKYRKNEAKALNSVRNILNEQRREDNKPEFKYKRELVFLSILCINIGLWFLILKLTGVIK